MVRKKKSSAAGRAPRRASGGWIKWEKALESDPRFTRMVRKLRTSVTSPLPERYACVLVIGCLIKLWSFADTHIRKDNILDLGKADVDEMVGVPGFADCMPVDWLRPIDETHVELPDFQAHNGVEAKRKALTQKRVANFNERRRNADVTQEKRTDNADTFIDQTRPDLLEEKEKTPPEAACVLVSEGGQADFAGPLPPQPEADPDPDDYLIWTSGIAFLGDDKRGLMGKLVKTHGRELVARKIGELLAMPEKPQDPTAYLLGALRKLERKAVF